VNIPCTLPAFSEQLSGHFLSYIYQPTKATMKQASLHYFKVLPKRHRGLPLKNHVILPMFAVLPTKTNATKRDAPTPLATVTEDSGEEYGEIEELAEVAEPKKKRPWIKLRTPMHHDILIKAMQHKGSLSHDCNIMYVPRTTLIYYQDFMTKTGKSIDELVPPFGVITESEIKFLVDAIRQRNILNCGMSCKEIIGVVQGMTGKQFKNCENHYDYLIKQKRLPELTKGGRVMTAQAITSKRTEVTIHQKKLTVGHLKMVLQC
jgi:hypothetical protein